MEYVPYITKNYNLDLQPTNSECIDVESAKSVLYPGAHIAASNPYDYYHHGIVLDLNAPDISIVHLWGPDKHHCRVQETTLPAFLAGGPDNVGKKTRRLYLVKYEDDTLEKQQEAVKMAKETLEKADDIEYDLATLNCENFACFCRTGKWDSEQIDRVKNLVVENAATIYEQVKDANERNRRHIASILNTFPSDALPLLQRRLYDKLCEFYN